MIKKNIQWFQARMREHRLDSTAAHGAYFIIISFLPFIVVLLTLLQVVKLPGVELNSVSLMDQVLSIFPGSIAAYLTGLMAESTPVSSILSVSIITFLWTASSGMVAVIKGLDTIYEVEETRGYLHMRLISMLYLLIFAVALVLTAVTQVFGSMIYHQIVSESPPLLAKLLLQFKSIFGLLLLIVFFCIMFTAIPRKRVKFTYNFVGAAFSATGWVLFSYFFSIFVENFANYSVVYGGLATLIILMLWLFTCMYILFMGAEVAMWLEKCRPQEDFRRWRAAQESKAPVRHAESRTGQQAAYQTEESGGAPRFKQGVKGDKSPVTPKNKAGKH